MRIGGNRQWLGSSIAALSLLVSSSALAGTIMAGDTLKFERYYDSTGELFDPGFGSTVSSTVVLSGPDVSGDWGGFILWDAEADSIVFDFVKSGAGGDLTCTVSCTGLPGSVMDGFRLTLLRSGQQVAFTSVLATNLTTTNQSVAVIDKGTILVNINGRGSDGGVADLRLDVGGGAVPEPSTWAMMILGFGAVGSAMRSRRRALA